MLDFEEFLVCLALCGNVKYAEVQAMDTAQSTESMKFELEMEEYRTQLARASEEVADMQARSHD